MNPPDAYQNLRDQMVAAQIERRGLKEPRLLAALRSVPRHRFVPDSVRELAYEDCPLPIGWGQTISQPYIVALMTSLLALEGPETILEIGTGSGYQAAVLSRMAQTVHTIETLDKLAVRARQVLDELGCANVFVHTGDGSLGWPAAAPYGGILITAAAPRPPAPVLEQLAAGGRMVIPVGRSYGQDLQVWEHTPSGYEFSSILPVAFVPLRGQFGWSEDEWIH